MASFPAAPLLTDIRRSTVGPGTLEDFVVTVYSVVMEYIAPALASFKLLFNRSTCSGGKVLFCLQWPQNLRQWWAIAPAPVVIASRAPRLELFSSGGTGDLGIEVPGSAPGKASVESVQSNWCRLVGDIMLADAD